jgi:hypothetical protein
MYVPRAGEAVELRNTILHHGIVLSVAELENELSGLRMSRG